MAKDIVSATVTPALASWLPRQVALTPDAVALRDLASNRHYTYAELTREVTACAASLRAATLGPSDRLAIAADRSAQTVIWILAAIDCGVAYVPLDLSYPAERLRGMLEDTQPRAVVGHASAMAQLSDRVGDVPELSAPAPAVALHAAKDDLVYVLFTSGSTGRPKGVAMGHAPLAHLIHWHSQHERLGRAAKTLQFAPLSFDVHFQEIMGCVATGGCLVLVDEATRRDPNALLDLIAAQHVQRVYLPYVALQMLADAAQDQALPLVDVVSAGEQLVLSPAIRRLFSACPNAALHNHYGPTESHVVTAHELTGAIAQWPAVAPIGKPLPHVQLRLLPLADAEAGEGELLIGGDCLAHGYIGRPELGSERFIDDDAGQHWYRSGDRARGDAEGVWHYLGRADHQLKIDGFRIEPGEVESGLLALPGIREAAVGAVEDAMGQKSLAAWLVLAEPTALDTQAWRTRLREQLPEAWVPLHFVVLDALPKTPSGKLDRKALPSPLQAKRSSAEQRSNRRPIEHIREAWREALGQPDLSDSASVFDAGARSLLVLRVVSRLKSEGLATLTVAAVYDHPSIAAQAAFVENAHQGKRSATANKRLRAENAHEPLAVVGMAVRAAGCANLEAFWAALLCGKEGIRHFSPEELDASVSAEMRSRSNFVAARGVLEDADRFDASFFGIGAREATLIDPQQRLLLELAWTALEHAGIPPSAEATIGVWAGTANNSYTPALRAHAPQLVGQSGEFAVMLGAEKDYAATRIAHRLNLTGPAVSLNTACSTGLVAISEACEALWAGRCDVALAGGASILVPQANGYLHVEGGMESADGHCRPFDAAATGTVFASAGAMVVLKRLSQAQADGDTIHALVRGVGMNNDGGEKASFTAPSQRGQTAAIRMALDRAEITANSVGFVEAHGTGTALGDPIEVSALAEAYGTEPVSAGHCVLGSLKSNFGHTIAAAGVLGFIKATLSLREQCIPGTLHYASPNPQIGLDNTPFRIHRENQAWPRSESPRRAAVSSFGVGGTNAHVVLEEAPLALTRSPLAGGEQSEPSSSVWLLPLSAKDSASLQRRAHQLADWLEANPKVKLQSVQAALVRGRTPFTARLAVAGRDTADLTHALREAKLVKSKASAPRLVWLFPGQGAQHAGMAASMYRDAPAFAAALNDAIAACAPHLDVDFGALLLQPASEQSTALITETRYAQPALFCMGYAMAHWLLAQSLKPDALIGHSIGEYAAACVAGVMDLATAARAVCVRGAAMWAQAPGGMAAVRLSAASLAPLLSKGLEIAAFNAPELTVVAGPSDALDAWCDEREAQGVALTRLRVSHAFHSASMESAIPRVREALQSSTLGEPQQLTYSCVTGQALRADQATDAQYWAQQVREPVQFAAAIAAEQAKEDTVFIDLGPSQALSALLRLSPNAQGQALRCIALLPSASAQVDASVYALQALGNLWCAGATLDWGVPKNSARAPLPTYPFADERFWFAPGASPSATIPPSAENFDANVVASTEVLMDDRLPRINTRLRSLMADVAGCDASELAPDTAFLEQDFDSLTLTQATLEIERVFGLKLRFRRLMEDLDTIDKLAVLLHAQLPADQFAAEPRVSQTAQTYAPPAASNAQAASTYAPLQGDLVGLMSQQLALMQQTLAMINQGGQHAAPPVPTIPTNTAQRSMAEASPSLVRTEPAIEAPPAPDLYAQPFGASARITLAPKHGMSGAQQAWMADFTTRYLAKTGRSRQFSQANRALMADPRVVTGFNPLWKDLVYPIVADASEGATVTDIDGNTYIDLLSCFGANLLGYKPRAVTDAMHAQLERGIEVGPQHPLAAEVARRMSQITGHARIGFCNTGSEAVMGAMRIARTVTGRKTIAIFTNSYHGIFDEVIVRGTKQLRSLAAAPGILANAVENILVLDYASDDSLKVLRERAHELAAIMIEPIQNKNPTLQPREFVAQLRGIADQAGCALIFDEVVTGFRVAPGGAQEFYGVRADLCTYGKIIGGGLPFAAIGGSAHWMDALDGGFWQFGDASFPEAGVTYFAGTFVRHPLALAAANATLQHLQARGPALYAELNGRTDALVSRLNAGFAERDAPVRAVHCTSLWRLHWDDGEKYVSLFYYLARFHGLHVYEQFGHFVTEAMHEAEISRIGDIYLAALDELMALGFIKRRDGQPTPPRGDSERSELQAENSGLSHGQEERWLAAQFSSEAMRALVETFDLRFDNVDVPKLGEALDAVMARHDAFRMALGADSPLQMRMAGQPPSARRCDHRASSDAAGALASEMTSLVEQPFALGEAGLVRVVLHRMGEREAVVHVVANHLAFDGWSASVFVEELAALYSALCRGKSASLPSPASPFRFARNLRARMDGEEGQADLAFWKAALASPPEALQIGDIAPPKARKFTASTRHVVFDAALTQALRAVAQGRRATLFQALLAAVAETIGGISGRDDFVLCLPYAGQSLESNGPLLCDAVFDLPLRVRGAASHSASDLLPELRTAVMDATEHPLMTQGRIARAMQLPSRGDRPPLSGVYFNLNPKVKLEAFAPARVELREGEKPGLLGKLIFNFHDLGETLGLDLHYSNEFISSERITSIAQKLMVSMRLLGGLPMPERDSTGASIEIDKPRVLEGMKRALAFNRVQDMVAEQARKNPAAVAVRADNKSLQYDELIHRSRRIAHWLRNQGVRPGQRVGLCLTRNIDLLPCLLGVLEVGAAYVPLDPNFPTERLKHMVEDSDLSLIVAQSEHAARFAGSVPCALIDADSPKIDALPSSSLEAPVANDAAAYVIYTSGSTGKPKGVVVGHAAACNFLASMTREPGLQAGQRLLATTTLSFDISVLELFLPLTVGATTVIADREHAVDGEALARLLVQENIDVLQGTPTTWHLLLTSDWNPSSGFQALCGGEALTPALASALLAKGVTLWNLYGPTETTVWSTVARISDGSLPIHIGHPIDNTQIRIIDEQGRDCDLDQQGELLIGGLGLAQGYHGLPELTADRFVTLPIGQDQSARFYRTGDLASRTSSGLLMHHGRIDAQVKIRGYRIELGEIEAALDALPEIARSAVVVDEGVNGDKRLVAHVEARSGFAPERESIRRELRARLPEYMLPSQVLVVQQLPLLPNGKVNRKALASPARSNTTPPSAPLPQGERVDDLVHAVLAHFRTVLQMPSLGPDDNFFEAGGHSLLAAELAGLLKPLLGQRPSLKQIFDHPTARKLANATRSQVAAARAEHLERSVPVLRPRAVASDVAPLSLQQQRLWFLENLLPGTSMNTVPSAHRLLGPMDSAAFERALRKLVTRQEVLRTVFENNDGTGQQRLLPVPATVLSQVDLSGLSPVQAQETLKKDIDANAERAFALGREPLYRACLYKISATDHVFAIHFHHLVWDGWSFDLLYQELSELYAAEVESRPHHLPELPLSYADYSVWQSEWVRSPAMAEQTRYWVQQLTPLPAPLALPADHARPPLLTGHGGAIHLQLDPEHVDALRELARQQGSTLFVLLLSAYLAWLHQTTGQDDLVVGVPVRGREQAEWQSLMGFFVNALPMRSRWSSKATLSEWIQSVHKTVTDAFVAPDVPMEHLVRALRPPRDPSRLPVYQALFSFQDVRERPTRWGALQHERHEIERHSSTEDWGLWCVQTGKGMEAVFNFNADLFSAATAKRYAEEVLETMLRVSKAGSLNQLAASLLAPARAPDVSSASHMHDSEEQAFIARLWCDLLELNSVSGDDNFFELGGHSLLALTFVNRTESVYGVRLPLLKIAHRSLAGLAEDLALARGEREAPLNSGSASANMPPKRSVMGWLKGALARRPS
jgi:amino acid adenylation domain-containing protein